jgi:hypothetical protein
MTPTEADRDGTVRAWWADHPTPRPPGDKSPGSGNEAPRGGAMPRLWRGRALPATARQGFVFQARGL